VRRSDLDHPDELRIDLDPMPDVPWSQVREVALTVRELFGEMQLRGYPKTSGSRGIHVNVRIEPEWSFTEVRTAALALARDVERRMPRRATSKWWKEERIGVFLDYNQNARDRTVASAYSVRPVADARVSTPLRWDEVADVEPADLRLDTVPERVETLGDPAADIDADRGGWTACSTSRRDEEEGSAARRGRRTSPSSRASPGESSRPRRARSRASSVAAARVPDRRTPPPARSRPAMGCSTTVYPVHTTDRMGMREPRREHRWCPSPRHGALGRLPRVFSLASDAW
jgi:bifunctional non-homologous end joining protein LigD